MKERDDFNAATNALVLEAIRLTVAAIDRDLPVGGLAIGDLLTFPRVGTTERLWMEIRRVRDELRDHRVGKLATPTVAKP